MPIMGFWAVLFLISKNAEGGRDWSSFLMMGIAGTGALAGVWLGLARLTRPCKGPQDDETAQGGPKSRAELIYGGAGPEDKSRSEEEQP